MMYSLPMKKAVHRRTANIRAVKHPIFSTPSDVLLRNRYIEAIISEISIIAPNNISIGENHK